MSLNKYALDRSGQTYIVLGILGCLTVFLWDSPYFLVAPMLLGIAPWFLYRGFANPAIFCLAFLPFGVFRLQEAITFLNPFKIPFVLATFGILSLMLNVLKGNVVPYWRKEITYFVIFFIWVTIGVFLSNTFMLCYTYWSQTFIKIFIIFFMITWTISDSKQYFWVIAINIGSGVIIALLVLYNQRHGIGLVEGTRVTLTSKLASILQDPNDLALILLFPFSFCFALLASRKNTLLLRFIGLISSAPLFKAILATESRGGLLGLIGVMMYFFCYHMKSKLLIISFIGISLGFAYLGIQLLHRESGVSHPTTLDESAMGRVYAWETAINMAIQHPFWGVGLRAFLTNSYQYAVNWVGVNHDVHSSWFGVLAESGFPGFALFILCVYSALKTSRANLKTIEMVEVTSYPHKIIYFNLANSLYAGLIGYCISSSFLTQGFTWPFYMYYALSISLAHSVSKQLGDSEKKENANI